MNNTTPDSETPSAVLSICTGCGRDCWVPAGHGKEVWPLCRVCWHRHDTPSPALYNDARGDDDDTPL